MSGAFHHNHSPNIRLLEERTVAHRVDNFCKAVVFTEGPIPIGTLFQVKLIEEKYEEHRDSGPGSLSFGVTTSCPDTIDIVSYTRQCSTDSWMLLFSSAYNDSDEKRYNFNLDSLSVGQSVGCCVTSAGELHYYIDGSFKCIGWTGLPITQKFWGTIGLNGPITKIKSELNTMSSSLAPKKHSTIPKMWAKKIFNGQGPRLEHESQTLDTECYKFKEGDRVVLQSMNNKAVNGTVRWVGLWSVQETGTVPIKAVGVETDIRINVDEEFPELNLNVTGSCGQDLFQIAIDHGRIFLPEPFIVHHDEYAYRQQIDNSDEVRLAKEYGLSVEEYRTQQKMLDEANQTRDIEWERTKECRVSQQKTDYGSLTGFAKHQRQIEVSPATLQSFSKRREQESQVCQMYKSRDIERDGTLKTKVELPHPRPDNSLQQVQTLREQLARQEREFQKERSMLHNKEGQLQQSLLQLQISNDNLRSKHALLEKNNREAQQYFQSEKDQLEREKKYLHKKLTDLQVSCAQDKEDFTELQGQFARLRIENMRLKGQVAQQQHQQNSVVDINYWEVSHVHVKSSQVILGEGGWGKVQVGLLQGQKVAVKMLHAEIVSPHYNQLVRREISMMAKLRHPNLLLFIAAVLDHPSGSPIIITELLDTSLRKAYKDDMLPNRQIKLCLLRDVAAALNYLHCHKDQIIHRDVSSANVLLEAKGLNKWKAKLSDFGSANLARLSMTTGPGAQVYAAPEVPQIQTPKMDVYSFGILLCEVLTNQFPFPQSFPAMLQLVASNWSLMHQVIESCTKPSPADRPDMEHVLQIFYDNFSTTLMTDLNAFTNM